jgi:hypothetical protein
MRAKLLALSGAILLAAGCAHAEPLPVKVGQCTNTMIKDIGSRLENMPDSGDAVSYANGGSQVSYDTIKGLKGSRPGDPVRLCLKSLPQDCPPGDERGKNYRATNLRIHSSWEAFDSEHMCGGA